MVAGGAIAIAVSLLALAGVRDGWVYFLPVDQFVENASQHTQRVRLHGKVGIENFSENRAGLLASFDLLGHAHSVRVQYTGVIPEMFQADRDVVVEGKLNDAGVFEADTLLTKCASKYESADGQAPHADPHHGEKSNATGGTNG
jgi:cytochrome c-type biogenesis protein CcmE